jgi:hypothetical protein
VITQKSEKSKEIEKLSLENKKFDFEFGVTQKYLKSSKTSDKIKL